MKYGVWIILNHHTNYVFSHLVVLICGNSVLLHFMKTDNNTCLQLTRAPLENINFNVYIHLKAAFNLLTFTAVAIIM